MSKKEIISLAVQTWGEDSQLDCTIEELSELTKEIIKHKRGYNNYNAIAEEIVDVSIMIDQLKLICNIKEADLQKIEEFKLERIKKALKE